MAEDREIKLTAEDYKVFFSAIGALEIAGEIINDNDIQDNLKTCAGVFIEHMSHTLDDSVFSLFGELDKNEAAMQIANAWTDIEREVLKRSIVTRITVDADEK